MNNLLVWEYLFVGSFYCDKICSNYDVDVLPLCILFTIILVYSSVEIMFGVCIAYADHACFMTFCEYYYYNLCIFCAFHPILYNYLHCCTLLYFILFVSIEI